MIVDFDSSGVNLMFMLLYVLISSFVMWWCRLVLYLLCGMNMRYDMKWLNWLWCMNRCVCWCFCRCRMLSVML